MDLTWQQLAAHPAQRVAAIKAYRDQHGVGLAEAKAAVEKFIAGGCKPPRPRAKKPKAKPEQSSDSFPDAKVVKAARKWLQSEGTVTLIARDDRHEILSAAYPPGTPRVMTYAPLMLSLERYGMYLLVRCLMRDEGATDAQPEDGALGYFLMQTATQLRLALVQVVASELTRAKRLQSLQSLTYSPYVLAEDALSILLALSTGDVPFVARLMITFQANESAFGAEIPRPNFEIPTASFAMRLAAARCGRSLDGSKYNAAAPPVYESVLRTLSSDGGEWGPALAALCAHYQAQSKDLDASDELFYRYPYQLYPVAPLAALMVRRSGIWLRDEAIVLPWAFKSIGAVERTAIAEDSLYLAVCQVIRAGFPDFAFPLDNLAERS